ncbi:hypothetical protein BDAP_001020 [Binucleata daphniae]
MVQKGFTKAAEEIYNKAIQTVTEYAHSQITLEHVLKELIHMLNIEQDDKNKISYEVMNKLRLQPTKTAKPTPSREFVQFIQEADKIADSYNDKYISVDHFILSLIKLYKDNEAFNALKEKIKEDVIKNKKPADSTTSDNKAAQIPAFATDMVAQAKAGKFDPVIGRDEQIRSVIEILSKREKSNPILIGNPGVGKTAIVNALAVEIANDRLPTLKDCVIYNVDIGSIVAGTGVRGEFEDRFKKIIKEASENSNVILFIDEIHMLINAGSCQGTMDAANMLKPQLANGDIKCIGATTFYEYRKYIESDPAFARRFVKVDVCEPSIDDSITMLRGLKERIEMHHGTRIQDSALVSAVKMAKKYIPGKMLPDSAIDLIDTACASAVINVESDTAEALKIKSKMWSLGLEKTSLELDLKRKTEQSNESKEQKDENVKKGKNEKTSEDKITSTIKNDEIEKVKERIKNIQNEMHAYQEKLAPIESKSAAMKQSIEEVRNLKQKIEQYKIKLSNAERERDNYTAAEIQNYIMPNLIEKLQQQQKNVITEITPFQIAEIISRWTGVPVSRLTLEENERLLCMYDRIKSKIFGQDEAVNTIVDALLTNRAGLSEQNRPIGCFLFLGPTGVGKTEVAKAVCFELFDNEKSVVIDMSDYSTEISVSKLISVSAGYVGYGEGGKLTEPVKNKPYSVVLLDEIDLAHPSVFNVMYQLLDEGRIVDGKGTEVDFRNCVIIMTSNLGYKDFTGDGSIQCRERAEKIAINKFGPALFNRIDSVIHFDPLSCEVLSKVLDYQIEKINHKLAEQNVKLNFTNEAKAKILEKCCSVEFGARPLKKYLQKVFVGKVAKLLLSRKDPRKLTIVNVDIPSNDDGNTDFAYKMEEY